MERSWSVWSLAQVRTLVTQSSLKFGEIVKYFELNDMSSNYCR